MSAAVKARRWIALAAAAAIVAHAFGMGLLGPRMAETATVAFAAEPAKSPAAEDCPSHVAAAVGPVQSGQDDRGADGKDPPSCERCPLGQTGMALGTPPIEPAATAAFRVGSATQPVHDILVEAWPYRAPPARAPPSGNS